MISLKKHIDDCEDGPPDSALNAYRSLLSTVSECGARAVPDLAADLSLLTNLHAGLSSVADAAALGRTHEEAQATLSQWSDKAQARHSDSERELKEIIALLGRAFQTLADRDDSYSQRVGELTTRLRSIANLNDLAEIRRSIVESVGALTVCVESIARESKESLLRLSNELDHYRTRLDKSEELCEEDSLTGLANRRAFENTMDVMTRAGRRFSLILIDLNDFKEVNDQFGHLAGDDLLKQFAERLRAQFVLADLVARWGGDEFAVIISSTEKDAVSRVHRLRRSVLGDYTITTNHRKAIVSLDAAIGVAEWNGSESSRELVARADHSMYADKQARRFQCG